MTGTVTPGMARDHPEVAAATLAVGQRPRRWPVLSATLLVALLAWSYHGAGIDLATLLSREALRQIGLYVVKLFPPDLSAAALRDAGVGAVETFAISLVGSVLSVCIALPLALGATRTILYRGILYEGQRLGPGQKGVRVAVYAACKAVLAVFRTVPEIVWALIFVFVVGLGPFPGVLALGFHTGGVLGKLFGEVLEDVDSQPLEALQATGASRLGIVLYGILPQALPQFVSYALYRWEVNIRAAAVMGFVGAGGLGQRIHVAISLFHEHQLLTLVLAIYVMVTLVDALSAWLRSRLI
jgi:phosphonate transport system permease protein